jgi:hypothetical protein
MNNFELETLLFNTKCAEKYGKNSIQVLACDQLPTDELLPVNSTVIANLSPISSKGTHWCLFHRPENAQKHCDSQLKSKYTTPLLWFDSLGITHRKAYPQFECFLANYRPLLSNDGQPVQEFRRYSESCGMFCLYVGMKLCDGDSYPRILSEFDKSELNLNECMVLEYLNRQFNTQYFNKYEGCMMQQT